MKLRLRLLITAFAAAVPAAILLYLLVDHFREQEQRLALERVVAAQLTDDTRQRCESNPNWFLAGPRPDRPTAEQLAAPDADVTAPRPPVQELPFEYFAYDETYQPLSTAGPRLPADVRQALRSGKKTLTLPFDTSSGSGWQLVMVTGWEHSSCVALLFRMRPLPGVASARLWTFLALFGSLAGMALLAAGPLVWRLRRLSLEARQSANDEYRSTIDSKGRDEVSAVAFAFNEAATDIRRRATDVKDREESLRRYIANTATSVTEPLLALEQRLGEAGRISGQSDMQAALQRAVIDAHSLTMRIQTLSVAATLRMTMETAASDVVDLNELIRNVAVRQQAFARASGVTIKESPASPALSVKAGRVFLEQALNNLVDNAIRYNRPGGQAMIAVEPTRDGRFSLRVSDDGPGAPDDVLANLNANRRFRGDEGRSGRPGELGLGLAVVREVCDRFGIKWAFRKSAQGWFEAELTGPIR
jgi:signal transduction histidine kinase